MTRRIVLIAMVLVSLLAVTFTAAQASHRGPDSVITANVEQALDKAFKAEPTGMNGSRLGVKTFDGVVMLSGDVKNEAEKVKAVETAKKVKGVKSIDDRITVVSGH